MSRPRRGWSQAADGYVPRGLRDTEVQKVLWSSAVINGPLVGEGGAGGKKGMKGHGNWLWTREGMPVTGGERGLGKQMEVVPA